MNDLFFICVYMCVYAYMQVLIRPKEGVGPSGLGIVDSCEPPLASADTELRSSK